MLAALRALDGEPGVTILHEPAPFPEINSWAVPLGLTIETQSELVPAYTEWYAVISAEYPVGSLVLYPALHDSIETTFPHQNANVDGGRRPWRDGRLCVDRPNRPLLGEAGAGQPTSARARLAWHIASAREWLTAAATGQLLRVGDPFEMPIFVPRDEELMILYAEDSATFLTWTAAGYATRILWGRAELRQLPRGQMVVDRFLIRSRVAQPPWGALVRAGAQLHAHWMLLPMLPLVRAYQTPATWDELHGVVAAVGFNLDEALRDIVAAAREGGGQRLLLVGFPISETVGGPPIEVAWQGLRLPEFRRVLNVRGKALWKVDRGRTLGGSSPIAWCPSLNVSESHQRIRGELPPSLRDARVCVVGVGSLGSIIAEMLVRMGLRDLALLDYDHFGIANVRRHVLTIGDIGVLKVDALEHRLNDISLFANVRGIVAFLPSAKADEVLRECDIIIDCSASDDVVVALGQPLGECRAYFSFSISAHARKLLAFTNYGPAFDVNAFYDIATPFAEESGRALAAEPAIRDPGCHNPAFPAPLHNILSLATRAVSFIVELHINNGAGPVGRVIDVGH